MKIEKVICDRCGKEVTYPATRKMFLSKVGREGGLDLCDNCHDELNEWFLNKTLNDLRIESLKFLRRLMLKQGETRHEMPEYFEDDFYSLIMDYKPLKEHIFKFYNEGKEGLKDEKK